MYNTPEFVVYDLETLSDIMALALSQVGCACSGVRSGRAPSCGCGSNHPTVLGCQGPVR